MKLYPLPLVPLLLLSCNSYNGNNSDKQVTLILQPFNDFPKEKLVSVTKELQRIFPDIKIKPAIPFPDNAYNSERNRYRADSSIAYLSKKTAPGTVTLGLTTKDISTTKGKHKDWGVMGLGYRPSKACMGFVNPAITIL